MNAMDKIVARADHVARRNLNRWQRAVQKAQANAYVQDDFFKDVVSSWVEVTLGLWTGELESIAQAEIVKGIDTAEGTALVSAPAAGNPSWTNLRLMDRGPKPVPNPTDPIGSADVSAELSADRSTLRVSIGNLKNLRAEPGAVYTGLVDIGGVEIAKIEAVVKS